MSSELSGSSIELAPEQYEEVEKLAGAQYSPEQIALYLDIPEKIFLQAFHAPDSRLKYHYDRGLLLLQAQSNMELYESAKKGNITALQQLNKAASYNKLENAKRKALINKDRQSLSELQEWVQKRNKGEFPQELAMYYEQLDMIRSLWYKRHTKGFIIKVLLDCYPDLTLYKANQLFADSINFFYLDQDISEAAWCNVYADWCDQMAAVAFEMSDFETARLLIRDAQGYRMQASNFKPKDDEKKSKTIVIYTSNPEELGLPRADRKLLREHIESLSDISDADRDRLHLEAGTGEAKNPVLGVNVKELPFVKKQENEPGSED